jgi:hypothetical protein
VCVRVRARARVCVCVCDAGADCLSISTHEERRKAGDRRPAVSLDTALICSVEQQVVDATVARAEGLSAFDDSKRSSVIIFCKSTQRCKTILVRMAIGLRA